MNRSAVADHRTFEALRATILDQHFPEPVMPADHKTMRAIALDALMSNQRISIVCGGAQIDITPKLSARLRAALVAELQAEIALENLPKPKDETPFYG